MSAKVKPPAAWTKARPRCAADQRSDTKAIFKARKVPKGFPAGLAKVARRRLAQVDAAVVLDDLKVPPGNRLEALKHDLMGKHSIRINDQWRIVFKWTDTGPADVEITDYH